MSDQSELELEGDRAEAAEPADPSRVHARQSQEGFARLWADDATIYLSGYLANLSDGGMFVRLVDPPPVGTRLLFELELEGGRERREGVGEVVWSRWKYGGPRRPPGIGVRFLRLETVEARRHQGEAAAVATEPEPVPSPSPVPPPPLAETPEAPRGDVLQGLDEASLRDPAPPSPPAALPPRRVDGPTEAPLARSGDPTQERLGRVEAVPWLEEVTAERPASRRWVPVALLLGVVLGGGLWWLLRRPAEVAVAGTPTVAPAALGEAAPEPAASIPPPASEEPPPGEEPSHAALPTPVEAVAPTPEPTPWPALSRVQEVSWGSEPGRTTVRVTGDGRLPADRVEISRIGLPNPRAVVELKGILEPYRPAVLEIASPQVLRARFGHHPPATLRMVLDLSSAELHIDVAATAPNQLALVIERR